MIPTDAELRKRFELSEDVHLISFPALRAQSESDEQPWLNLLYSDTVCDMGLLTQTVLPALRRELDFLSEEASVPDLSRIVTLLALKKIRHNDSDITESLFSGHILFLFPAEQVVYAFDAGGKHLRNPQDPITETSIKGARDGFIESLDVNVALIRQRVKSDTLAYRTWTIGETSHTKVGILYLADRAFPGIVEQIANRLTTMKVDTPIGITDLEEHLSPFRYSIFPLLDYTGRPDFAFDCLARGKIVIIMDRCPVVLVAPASLVQLLVSPEDLSMPFYFVWPYRLLRLVSTIAALALPGFYVSLIAYHPDQIPFPLVATISNARLGLPVSAPLEMFLVLTLLSLLREAGTRMPQPIASTFTVIAGLIIGDSAIRAGIFSPLMVVIGAISVVAGSTIVNQDFSVSVTLLRLYILIASSIMGLYGFFLSLFSLVLYMAALEPFGLPYLTPFSPVSFSRLASNFFRLPGRKRKGGGT